VAAVDIVAAEYGRAISALELAVELMQQSENARHEVVVHINRLQARLGISDLYGAAALCGTIREMVREDTHWEVRLAANLALADYHLVVGEVSRALGLIEQSSRLAATRESRILEPAQFLRLEVLRRVHSDGPTEAKEWLLHVGLNLAKGQVVTRLTFNALATWLESLLRSSGRQEFAAAMEAIATSGAYGLLDELRWSGVGGQLGPTPPPKPVLDAS
jgi:ATP/maltotriose-dependent transcriptional regulator MalT